MKLPTLGGFDLHTHVVHSKAQEIMIPLQMAFFFSCRLKLAVTFRAPNRISQWPCLSRKSLFFSYKKKIQIILLFPRK